ncbi:MAG: hypothetical protein F6J89_09275 [Symploca sp. SIO1C4]|uniref:Uncharacterized protein n=1 Tax=Symploca sp. SIO1C4 TaxID=2607765 RepID=A0A6B3N848_9CYAN|nr:hypothetical protein [Symploca sp. SIO1C4]
MTTQTGASIEGNDSKPPEWTEEEYKRICQQVNHFQRAKRKRKKVKPVLKPRGKVTEKQITISIEDSACDWDDIKDEPFSLDTSATRIYVKIGKERAKCVNTGKSIPVGGAAVYRVFF